MKPFFIFRFFPFFCQIAKRKVLVFCSQCFAYYTTTRENRELRRLKMAKKKTGNYTTTRENRELRQVRRVLQSLIDYTTTRENRELRPTAIMDWFGDKLYHYERKQGTTTCRLGWSVCHRLYHYERKQGTTTRASCFVFSVALYHYERKQGTTTPLFPRL